jgi:hypothetical protein
MEEHPIEAYILFSEWHSLFYYSSLF